MTTIEINPDDVQYVLDEIEGLCPPSLINCYFVNASYDLTSAGERNAALINMRRAWIAALTPELGLSRACSHVRKQEFHVRDSMNTVDGLPVPLILWDSRWSDDD